jgi:hypothetical protein
VELVFDCTSKRPFAGRSCFEWLPVEQKKGSQRGSPLLLLAAVPVGLLLAFQFIGQGTGAVKLA